MEPGVLIFLLYVMIIHELVCGWMEYQRQASKPKKQARPVWSSSSVKSGSLTHSRSLNRYTKREKFRDWKKSGRIVRKA
ncbi:hypothetical protein chiPu_0010026 [Chiloscyllium punctatum]|uniref:Uncharacterized protein n=1 Tax=Chiloscyllium punctatum TaxID=137246 RepID=A0A401SME6_CHIPU|nr:hypothetical protein [Chiloscyllium punctatum]